MRSSVLFCAQITMMVKDRPLTMEMMTQTSVDQLIALMLIEIEGHLPANAGPIPFEVEPQERKLALQDTVDREVVITQQNIGPCGECGCT